MTTKMKILKHNIWYNQEYTESNLTWSAVMGKFRMRIYIGENQPDPVFLVFCIMIHLMIVLQNERDI